MIRGLVEAGVQVGAVGLAAGVVGAGGGERGGQ